MNGDPLQKIVERLVAIYNDDELWLSPRPACGYHDAATPPSSPGNVVLRFDAPTERYIVALRPLKKFGEAIKDWKDVRINVALRYPGGAYIVEKVATQIDEVRSELTSRTGPVPPFPGVSHPLRQVDDRGKHGLSNLIHLFQSLKNEIDACSGEKKRDAAVVDEEARAQDKLMPRSPEESIGCDVAPDTDVARVGRAQNTVANEANHIKSLLALRDALRRYIEGNRTGSGFRGKYSPINPGHPVHAAVVAIEAFYLEKKLPFPAPWQCWQKLVESSRAGGETYEAGYAAFELERWASETAEAISLRVGAPIDGDNWRLCPLDRMCMELIKPDHATIDAIRAVVADWDGLNWSVVREALRNIGRTPNELMQMTVFDVRMAFSVSQKPMLKLMGSVHTNAPTTCKISFDDLDAVSLAAVQQTHPKSEERAKDNSDGSATQAICELSPRQQHILIALNELKAFSSDSRKTTSNLAARAEGPQAAPENFKDSIADLVRKGLASTKEGRGGGCWLTDSGRRRAEALDKL